ncbi:MAG TPA: AMP-binding protein [Stellaceae bacterium]|nr:AMP-binding protein [Stellaceae bacterium]
MTEADHYDAAETRDPRERETALFVRLPRVLEAALAAPGWRDHFGPLDPRAVTDRAALAKLPMLRKSNLPAMQKAAPPFAGLVPVPAAEFAHLFTSPGPIYEAEPRDADPWHAARALFAAGFRAGDIVLNTFSYHLTPGGFIMDSGARAVGCAVIPAGPGNTEQQLDVIAAYRPTAYAGTPDFLNILLEAAEKQGCDAGCIRKASVGGAAFPRSLQDRVAARGIAAYQTYAVAECGIVAYETPAREGLVISEDIIVEIVRPGTGDPVPDGEVGEVVVTTLDPRHPLFRVALGDLSAIMPGASPCGRTNRRLRGWLGRADQTTKIKGMFVRPDQIAEIARRHPELARLRLVVTRENEIDAMTLRAESAHADGALSNAVAATLQVVTKLKGAVALVPPGSLPNDGKVIADERA